MAFSVLANDIDTIVVALLLGGAPVICGGGRLTVSVAVCVATSVAVSVMLVGLGVIVWAVDCVRPAVDGSIYV